MTHDADRSDEERPSDADSGVRLSKNTGSNRSELETIADPNSADPGESARLPNWEDREKDARPGWEKAKIPKEEWLRAKTSNDAALARETPGSPEFARLMEARMHLHLGPPPDVDFGEISAYKRLKYQDALADDLRREIAEKEGAEAEASGLTTRRVVVVAGILVVVVVVLFLIVLRGPSGGTLSPSNTTAPAAAPTQPEGSPATAAEPRPSAPPALVAPTETGATSATATAGPTLVAPSTVRTAKPNVTTKPVPTTPAATGEVPFFKPKQK